MIKRLLISLTLILLSAGLFSQGDQSAIMEILKKRGEVLVAFRPDNRKALDEFRAHPGFDKILGDQVHLYLGRKDSLFISENAGRLELLPVPSMTASFKMASSREDVLEGRAYPGYSLYLEIMKYFGEQWPDLCQIDTIGRSVKGRLLLAARISRNVKAPGTKPVFMYSSSMHGDETLGYSLMLMLINHLLSNSEEQGISDLFDNAVILINPLENPDGTFYTNDETVFGATRNNANGVNLNRNYPDPLEGDHADGNEWQPETRAMMDYLKKHRPNMSANFHGGAEVVNYPFDSFSALHPDDAWMRMVASEYADTAMAASPGYMDEFPGGITNGYDWYSVHGGRQDYVTYFLGGREMTMEISNTKTVPEDQLSGFWELSKKSLLNYIRQSTFGLQGFVKDSLSGEALEAKIYIPGHDERNSEVFSDALKQGRFVRYLKSGNYNIEISKKGYYTKTIGNIRVEDYQKTSLMVSLLPRVIMVNIESYPGNNEIQLNILSPEEQRVKIGICDITGRLVFYRNAMISEGNVTLDAEINAGKGVYIVTIWFENEQKSFRILKF